MAITFVFLLVRSALGLPTCFFARPTFFAVLVFLTGLRLPLGFAGSDGGLLMLSLSIGFSLIGFSLTGLRSSMDHSRQEKKQAQSCGDQG
jgi:hypothetical protein